MHTRLATLRRRAPALLPVALAASVALGSAAAVLAADTAVPAGGTPRTVQRAEALWSHDGLRRTEVKGLDLVYVRPGAKMGGYRRVMLDPVQVAFRRDWDQSTVAGMRIRSEDALRIKNRFAKQLRDAAVKELSRGGYEVVEQGGDDVLQVGVSIVDLYLNAPDVQTAARVLTYTMSSGEMTLVAELRDSASGEIIARVLDRRLGRDRGFFRITTSIDNDIEAGEAAQTWAKILRERLDAARRIGS